MGCLSLATSINYTLPTAGRASLSVYDMAGKLVKTLVSGHLPAGPGQVTWNRTDDASTKVARGVYFCRLQTEDANLSRKLVAR
jgi:flagellar hook assembly protein FlgD